MRVYLDNCCYNRPYDDQSDFRVMMECIAKLQVQSMMRSHVIEYVWSDILTLEVSVNPFLDRQRAILDWAYGAAEIVATTEDVRERGREIQQYGIKPKDALHLASAEKSQCDWFLTTDKGILKKLHSLGMLRIANPIDFMLKEAEDEDKYNE